MSTEATTDSVCVECGYLLRGLADDGLCPECGTQVQRSLYQALHTLAPGTLRMYAIGATVMGIHAILVAIASSITFITSVRSDGEYPPMLVLFHSLYAYTPAIMLIGIWLLTTAPERKLRHQSSAAGNWSRISAGVALIMLLPPNTDDAYSTVQMFIAFAADLLLLFALRQLMLHSDDRAIQRWLWRSLIVALVLLAPTLVFNFVPAPPEVMSILAFAFAVLHITWAVLFIRARRVFARAEERSLRRWVSPVSTWPSSTADSEA